MSNSLHQKRTPEFKIIFAAFYKGSKTMLEVAEETGIDRANICRYVARLRSTDSIKQIEKGICPVSKFKAGFYSTDPMLINSSQD